MPSDPPLENNENVHIPRPPNAFMKFRSSLKGYTPPQEELAICNGSLSRWFGDKWKAMTKEEKKPFEVLADRAKEAHEIAYPGYVYRPRSKEQKEQERLARMAAGLPKLKKTRATPGTENSAVASGSGHHLTSPVTMALPSVPSNTVFFPPASLGSTSATLPLPPIHQALAVAQMNPVAYTTNTSWYQSPVTYQLHEQPQEALYQASLAPIQPDTQQPIVWTQSLIELLLQYVQYSQAVQDTKL
ncbi:hypothetical protein H0H87_005734 [Tephrocybe sp. NHM501043]|nr:hypothetical protein H0H87_005734 [Tephrocybe sp. NHM501043]